MRKKRVLAGVLSAAMVVGSLTLPENISISGFDFGALFAQAADDVASGTCGENLTWVLDDDGVLTISGTGEMEDYETIEYVSSAPWSIYCASIVSVVIEEGVTSIGDYAFYHCGVETVDLPDSLTRIGDYAFDGSALTSIDIPGGVTEISDRVFSMCAYLTSVNIPEGVTSIGNGAFIYCESLSDVYYLSSEDDWNKIDIGNDNECLTSATIHFTEYELGDANGDDEINYLDAMAVLRYDAELMEMTDVQLAAADVNDDGSVNSLDAILILRYDAGLIEEF